MMDMDRESASGRVVEQGVLSVVVSDVTKVQSGVLSEPRVVGGFPWKLLVMPQDVTSSSQQARGKAVRVYVQCVPKFNDWKVSAHVILTLLNHKNPTKNYTKEFNHCFTPQRHDWGYSAFIKWKTLIDPSKGFLKDNAITLQAHITTETSSNDSQTASNKSVEPPFLACPGCHDDFQVTGNKQPMSLRCGHTFCQECLEKWQSVGDEEQLMVKCLLCGQEHSGSAGQEPWFTNFSLIQVISSCNVVPKSRYYCSLHQHDKSFYCFDDQSLVCIYCAYQGEHKGHRCLYVEEARQQVDESVDLLELQASARASEMERSLIVLKSEQEHVLQQEKRVHGMVEDFFSSVEAAVMKQKDHLLQQLTANVGEVTGSISAQIRDQEGERNETMAVITECTSWKKLPARDALGSVAALQSKLKRVSSATPPAVAPCGVKFSFEIPCSDVFTSIGLLGQIHVAQRKGTTCKSLSDAETDVEKTSSDHESIVALTQSPSDKTTLKEDSLYASPTAEPPFKKPRV